MQQLSKLTLLVCITVIFVVSSVVALPASAQMPGLRAYYTDIPMSDGLKLAGDVFLPEKGSKFPTIVYRTPYEPRNRLVSAFINSFSKSESVGVLSSFACDH